MLSVGKQERIGKLHDRNSCLTQHSAYTSEKWFGTW